MSERAGGLVMIGERAPNFQAESTQGATNFPDDFRGKWIVFFSHPADFTPVCTTEFIAFAQAEPEFRALNAVLIGLSTDSVYSHIAWLRTIEERIHLPEAPEAKIAFPVISDPTMEVAQRYGMVHPGTSGTQTVRAVFILDPEGVVRALLYYPLSNGRNVSEIVRLVTAMQRTEKYQVATPANWQPGDEVLVAPPLSVEAAEERVAKVPPDSHCLDWFLCLKKDPARSTRTSGEEAKDAQ